jgi:hypothetical protein
MSAASLLRHAMLEPHWALGQTQTSKARRHPKGGPWTCIESYVSSKFTQACSDAVPGTAANTSPVGSAVLPWVVHQLVNNADDFYATADAAIMQSPLAHLSVSCHSAARVV